MLKEIKNWIKRKSYSLKQFQKDITVDTRSSRPICFILSTAIPVVHIYLKVANKSQYLDAIFDRAALLSLHIHTKGWRGILRQEDIMPRKMIERKSEGEIFCSFKLNERQIDVLEQINDTDKISARLFFEYHIDSSLYSFSDKVMLEDRPCEISR